MDRLKVHILYEYSVHKRPHSSAYIRLLRPLFHPSLQHQIEVTAGMTYKGQNVDVVILDRLWRPDISLPLAEQLVKEVHSSGARMIYSLDDIFLDLPDQRKDWPTEAHLQVVRFLLSAADGILVTTPMLKERLTKFNPNIAVVPHALDESLLKSYQSTNIDLPPDLSGTPTEAFNSTIQYIFNKLQVVQKKRITIGYMGTATHDDDLMMVFPALQAISERHRGKVELQIIGAIGHGQTRQMLKKLPGRLISLTSNQSEYPQFLAWFSSQVRWDIAIAPLRDTSFNRCKSDIKFLDYSILGAAGIYSCIPAYEETVRHQETGWLVDNNINSWIEALETLLTNEQLRKQIATNANRYLHHERILAHCAFWWIEAIKMLLNRT